MKLFEIKENQIIFYPKRNLYVGGALMCVCLYLVIIPLFFASNNDNLKSTNPYLLLLLLLIPLFVLTIFILIGNSKIIIDEISRKIIRKNVFGSKIIALVEDIYELRFTNDYSKFVITYVYELIRKDNPYGAGIILTPDLRLKSKELKELKESFILDRIFNILNRNETEIDHPNNNNNNNILKFFKEEHHNQFCYAEKKPIHLFVSIPLLILFFYSFNFISTSREIEVFFPFTFLFLAALCFIGYGDKITIDTYEKNIETSFFGLFKSKYHFHEINEIITSRKTSLEGRYEQTEIIIKTNRSKAPFQIILYASKDSRKISEFLNDLNILIK